MTAVAQEPGVHRNEVLLVGRVSKSPQVRQLPSGDSIVTGRLVVERRAAEPRRPKAPRLDVIDCVARYARCRRAMANWSDGDLVEVAGALRRRFYRGAAGVASRYEVEVVRTRRVSRARRPT